MEHVPSEPAGNVSKKPDGEKAKKSTQSSAETNNKNKNFPADGGDFVLPIIEVVLGLGVLGVLPDIFDDLGLHIFTIWAWWLSLVLGVLAVVQSVSTLRRKWKKTAWTTFKLFFVLIVVAFGFWTKVLLLPKVEPQKPRLTFAFFANPNTTSESVLEFTNDFFFKNRGVVKSSEVFGTLIVPINPGQSNSELAFGLIKTNESLCEVSQLQIDSTAFPAVSFGSGWVSMKPSGYFTSSAMMMCNLRAIGPFKAVFPQLTCSQVSETNRSLMFAHVMGEGFESTDLAFWLVFSSKVQKPHLVKSDIQFTKGTNFRLDMPNPEMSR